MDIQDTQRFPPLPSPRVRVEDDVIFFKEEVIRQRTFNSEIRNLCFNSIVTILIVIVGEVWK